MIDSFHLFDKRLGPTRALPLYIREERTSYNEGKEAYYNAYINSNYHIGSAAYCCFAGYINRWHSSSYSV